MTDLVVQLGARLDQFAADMNKAGDLADGAISRIEGAFSSLNPGLGGLTSLGGVLAGGVGAAVALFAALKSVNSELAEIGKLADYVGVSTGRLQQIKFGATQGGVSSSDASTDLKHVADLLADAKVNENSLTKILDANNIKYRDRNGQIMGMNGLLKAAADLLSRFESIPEKTKAAQMLGLSAGWVDALKGGPAAFEAIASSANAAGVVVESQTIAKARNFDEAWKKSTDLLSQQFKAAAGDIASYLDDLIGRANTFFAAASKGAGGSGADKPDLGNKFDRYADAAAVAMKQEMGLAQDLEQVQRVLDRVNASANPDSGLVTFLESVRDKAKQAAEYLAATQKLAGLMQGQTDANDRARRNEPEGPQVPPGWKPGVIPSRKTESNNGRDQFDIAVDQITKRTATLKADTAAVFQNNAAQAQFRAEFQELTAIMRDHGEVTQEQIDKYEALRGSMSAQQALERSGIQLTGAHKDAFLASSQAIGQATSAYDAAAGKLQKINSASSQIGSALSTAFGDVLVDSKNASEAVSNLLKTLEKAGINSIVGSFFNASSSGGLSPFASLLSSIIPGFAEGTDSAPGGLAWVGENGKELVNLPRGAQVVPNDVTRQLGGQAVSIVSHVDARGSNFTEAQLHAILDMRDRRLMSQVNSAAPGRSLRYSQLGS